MKSVIFYGCCLLAMWGCEDFIVKDIGKSRVLLLAPADSISTVHSSQTFAWEEVAEATGYRFVIVSPGFARPERWLLDTLVRMNRFSYELPEGEYEWGVRAENPEYATIYTCRRLTVVVKTKNDSDDAE